VAGTGMLGYGQLSDAQRWNLAFYVLSLRHEGADLAAGKRAFESHPIPIEASAAALSSLTEEEVLLAISSVPEAQRANVLAYLRAGAPFRAAEEKRGLSLTRDKLRAALQAYERGERAEARVLLVSAYLDGFEPHEVALGARDPGLVVEIEAKMLALRQDVAKGLPVERIRQQVSSLEALLDRAPRGPPDSAGAFLGALTISVREGLEIALLIGALLGLVRRRGNPELVRYVHAGWLAAIPAGLLTWLLAGKLLSGLQREVAEGVAAILAAVVLLGVTHWLLGQMTSRGFMGFVADSVDRAVAGPRAAASVMGLAFLAAYREAFEIVLFFQALLLDAGEAQRFVWLGALVGLALLVGATLVLRRLGQRLKPRPFMLFSSVLLSLLAFTLIGKGIRALQEAAVIDMNIIPVPELPILGIHATTQGLAAQGVLLVLLTGSALWPRFRSRRDMQTAHSD